MDQVTLRLETFAAELAPHHGAESIIAIAREGGRLRAYEFQTETQDKLNFETLVPIRKGEKSE